MELTAGAVLKSWSFDPGVLIPLGAAAALFIRGWARGRRSSRSKPDSRRLACFLGGLAVVFLALESPLDAIDELFLSAHMAQHLLLMTIAPPLILLGRPAIPLLRGLPRFFLKKAVGPLLAWPVLNCCLDWLAWPPLAWLAFAVSTIAWHLPRPYELALASPFWHDVQHACFFWTGMLFWNPVIQPVRPRARWPRWALIPYLLLGDILNTALSAFLVFSDRILYPSYAAIAASSLAAKQDQAAAGAIMWVPGSIVYLVPAVAIAARLFSGSERYPPDSGTEPRASASGGRPLPHGRGSVMDTRDREPRQKRRPSALRVQC